MLKNTTLMLATTMIRLATGVVVFLLLARSWGAEAFGAFMYAFTIASLAVMLVDYGFAIQTIKDISRHPARIRAVTARSLAGKVVLSVMLAAAFTVALVVLSPGHTLRWSATLLLAAAVVNSFALHLNCTLRAQGRFDDEAVVSAYASLALLGVVVAGLAAHVGVVAMAILFLGARVSYLAASVWYFRRVNGFLPLPRGTVRSVMSVLRSGAPYAVHIIVGTAYFQLDTLIIEHFRGAEGVGLFQAGARIMLAVLIIPDVLTNVYLPVLSRASGREALELGTRMMRTLLGAGVGAYAVLATLAEPIVGLLYGSKFASTVILLPLFGLIVLVRHAGAPLGLLLTTSNRQGTRSVAIVLALAVSLVANLGLVPMLGLRGAVIAGVITNLVLAFVYGAAVLAQYGRLPLDRRSLALLLLAAVIGVATALGRGSAVLLPGLATTAWLATTSGERRVLIARLQAIRQPSTVRG
jgi:O-antigen/teichoic acid export membrane protein